MASTRRLHLGDWHVGRVNVVLAVVQFLLWFECAARGLDYVQERPPAPSPAILSRIEVSAPLSLWGAGFLLAALLLFVGVAGRWWTVIIAGHAVAFALNGAFFGGTLLEVPFASPVLALGGTAVVGVGCFFALSEWRRDWTRFGLAMVAAAVGGWVAGAGLGYNFRTSADFAVFSLAHLAYGLGIAWLATRAKQTGGPTDGHP